MKTLHSRDWLKIFKFISKPIAKLWKKRRDRKKEERLLKKAEDENLY